MTHKTALVTGGTSGVGLSIVRELAQRGVRVHFIGTNEERGKQIEQELNGAGIPVCTFIQLDLSRLRGVRDFAHEFRSEVPELDILLNVAGVMLPKRQETREGIEKTLAVNHLSAFLLSRELTPALARASHARILNVSGAPAQVLKPRFDFDDLDLDFDKKYNGIRVAIDTVHAKTALTQTLAEKLESHGIDVNAFHPGTVKSELGRHLSFPMSLAFAIASRFMSKASESGIYVSTSPDLEGVTGQLFVKRRARPLNFERSYRERLWGVTEELITRAMS
jgi:NAD(P)-dependent dehydrogenase (short-subunit alcohol dehydrogenase family)